MYYAVNLALVGQSKLMDALMVIVSEVIKVLARMCNQLEENDRRRYSPVFSIYIIMADSGLVIQTEDNAHTVNKNQRMNDGREIEWLSEYGQQ